MDPISADCYPDTSVLINKFDIHDAAKLDEVENTIVSTRNAEWLQRPQVKTFDFAHYQAIHYFFFSDLYEWAGKIRTVNMSKKGTHFCLADEIAERAELIFMRLKHENYFQGLAHDAFVDEIVDFYCATNDLHPFREGNGRTQRAFLTQLIRNANYDISWKNADTDFLMIATIQAAGGVTDFLQDFFTKAIH